MKSYSRLVAAELTRQLVTAGVLTGDARDAITQLAPPRLLICQVDGPMLNSAFDLDCGGTGYMLSLHIAVDLPVFSIWDWRLDPPWEDPLIQWLPEPSGGVYPGNIYQFPGRSGLEFPRDVVINHRRKVRRGHSLDGLLLGCSFRSIPDTYKRGANIDASLVLIDEMGRKFSTPVQLCVDRMAKIDRKPTKKTKREPLFDDHWSAEEELVQA